LIDAAERDDGIRLVLGLVELVFLILTGVAWLIWQHRGHRIVRQRWGRLGTRFSPAWGVGCWFVPIANLALPCQAHAELWRASNLDAGPRDWTPGRLGWLIPMWWTVWLVSGFGGLVLSGAFALDEAITPDQLKTSFAASAVAALLQLIAAILALLLVRRLSRRILAADARLSWVDEPVGSLLPTVEGLPPPPSATRSPEPVAPIRGWFLAASAVVTLVGGIAAVLIASLELPASAL
jgi:hypothetical protein